MPLMKFTLKRTMGIILTLLAMVIIFLVILSTYSSKKTVTAADWSEGMSLPAAGYPERSGKLTDREMAVAKRAWSYFEKNYQPSTGLVNAVNNYPSTTMWDNASYMGALIAARELGIIDKTLFDQRMMKLLGTLNTLPLFRNELPNKVYNTKTAQPVNYKNEPGEIGFSALDMGRQLVMLKTVKERYPEYSNMIDNIMLRWDFSHVIQDCGTLYGANIDPQTKATQYVQEGRLGYEEYAAAGFKLWGFSTCKASQPEPYEMTNNLCVLVPYDARDPRKYNQHNYVVAESYVLYGLELGWNKISAYSKNDQLIPLKWIKNFADRVYQAQENRYYVKGIMTARSEHQLDRAPYFVYDSVYSDGYNWNTITDRGQYVPGVAAVSLKAALGMWALWKSPYTDRLFNFIENAFVDKTGYYEGIYENGSGPIREFTANNNGIMLEALLYKQQGRLLHFLPQDPKNPDYSPSLWDKTLLDAYNADNDRKGRPYLPETAANKTWCQDNGVSLRKQPAACCTCSSGCDEDKDFTVPPETAQCSIPK